MLKNGSTSLTIKGAVGLIRLYQKTLSPDHGWLKNFYPQGYCKFSPTCSEYSIEAVEAYGLLRGGALGFWRILRCNPWSKGGHDPVRLGRTGNVK